MRQEFLSNGEGNIEIKTMALLNVLIAPDPRLRKVGKTVDKIDGTVLKQLDDMLETMYENNGAGLAAVQVDIEKRLVVMDVAPLGKAPEPVKLINPEITWCSKETQLHDDGCLSVPGYWAKTKRPAELKYQYLDEKGNLVQKKAIGLEAACIHHEIDHLNGILFIDHISSLRRKMILKKLEKNTKQNYIQ